jgi:hypothetical protein
VFKKICDLGKRPKYVTYVRDLFESNKLALFQLQKKGEKQYISIHNLLNAEEQNGVRKHKKHILVNPS